MGAAICKRGRRKAAEPEAYDMRVTFRLQGRGDRSPHLRGEAVRDTALCGEKGEKPV